MRKQAAKTVKLMLAGTALGVAALAGPIASATETTGSTYTTLARVLAERLATAVGWPEGGTTCPYAGCPQ